MEDFRQAQKDNDIQPWTSTMTFRWFVRYPESLDKIIVTAEEIEAAGGDETLAKKEKKRQVSSVDLMKVHG